MKTINIILAALLILALPIYAFDANAQLTVKAVMNKDTATKLIPQTYAEADKAMILPRNKFLLYTLDGNNIMWGEFSKGYFKGQDTSGKYTWGIYGKDVFAGFYDGDFFWGRYRSGSWTAYGLFNLNFARGRYVVFPNIMPTVEATAKV